MTGSAVPGLLAGTLLALTGCGDGSTDEERVRQTAGMHQLAQELVTRPGVVCAQGLLDSQGLPSPPRGSLRVSVITQDMPGPEQKALVRDVAEQLWDSDLSVSLVYLEVRNPQTLPIDIGQVLGSNVSFATAEDLEKAFGPRPPRPRTLPALQDPGNPNARC